MRGVRNERRLRRKSDEEGSTEGGSETNRGREKEKRQQERARAGRLETERGCSLEESIVLSLSHSTHSQPGKGESGC